MGVLISHLGCPQDALRQRPRDAEPSGAKKLKRKKKKKWKNAPADEDAQQGAGFSATQGGEFTNAGIFGVAGSPEQSQPEQSPQHPALLICPATEVMTSREPLGHRSSPYLHHHHRRRLFVCFWGSTPGQQASGRYHSAARCVNSGSAPLTAS